MAPLVVPAHPPYAMLARQTVQLVVEFMQRVVDSADQEIQLVGWEEGLLHPAPKTERVVDRGETARRGSASPVGLQVLAFQPSRCVRMYSMRLRTGCTRKNEKVVSSRERRSRLKMWAGVGALWASEPDASPSLRDAHIPLYFLIVHVPEALSPADRWKRSSSRCTRPGLTRIHWARSSILSRWSSRWIASKS